MTAKPTKTDPKWRKKPRKPAALKKSKTIAIRLTSAEFNAIYAALAKVEPPMTLRDFIVAKIIS